MRTCVCSLCFLPLTIALHEASIPPVWFFFASANSVFIASIVLDWSLTTVTSAIMYLCIFSRIAPTCSLPTDTQSTSKILSASSICSIEEDDTAELIIKYLKII
ncbi:hypothetical protein BpHYR1_037263 [Brachionus plicatilis]|uniref:Uncharacterized protein n=1 Tax=Brachionus plicatilis TaxID=10195 RepID=A0A3M7R1S9_BRAPC|nr:hypothetical protein BpHYR1_037263 [Brachionus plicatilis]